MNVSLLNLSNHTNNNTNNTYFYNNSIEDNSTSNHISSNTTEDIIDLDLPNDPNITTTTEFEEEPTTIDPTTEPKENITTTTPPTELPTEPPTEPPNEPEDNTTTTELPTEPSSNLRGTEKNTTNNSKSSPSTINEQKLEETMIIVIFFCCLITLATVLGFVWIYCKHKKLSILPENEQNNKTKKRRISPELPKDFMIEKITEGLQYTNTYRNSSKFKKATTTIKAVGRLEKARKERAKRGPFPPEIGPPKNPPPSLPPPPPAPSVALQQVKTILESKNRNSWSIKELPTNTKEKSTDQIQHTNGMYALPDNTEQNTELPENKLLETKLAEKN